MLLLCGTISRTLKPQVNRSDKKPTNEVPPLVRILHRHPFPEKHPKPPPESRSSFPNYTPVFPGSSRNSCKTCEGWVKLEKQGRRTLFSTQAFENGLLLAQDEPTLACLPGSKCASRQDTGALGVLASTYFHERMRMSLGKLGALISSASRKGRGARLSDANRASLKTIATRDWYASQHMFPTRSHNASLQLFVTRDANAGFSVTLVRSASLLPAAARGLDAQALALKSPAVLLRAEGCFATRSLFASLCLIAARGRDAQALAHDATHGATASLNLTAIQEKCAQALAGDGPLWNHCEPHPDRRPKGEMRDRKGRPARNCKPNQGCRPKRGCANLRTTISLRLPKPKSECHPKSCCENFEEPCEVKEVKHGACFRV